MKNNNDLEIYALIKDFPNYLITSKGRVLSLKDSNGKDRILELKQRKNNRGYYCVNLYKNGKHYTKTVHRLVAMAFIRIPENKSEINHIDEDKSNNCVSNLEWITHKENCNHATRNERVSKAHMGNKNPMYGKKLSEETKAKISGVNNYKARAVIGFKINGCDIKYYKYMSECKRDGFHKSDISSCCKGKLKSAKGYKWYYADEYFNKNRGEKDE